MVSLSPACQVIFQHGKAFNIVIFFLDIINVINAKLRILALLSASYLFIPLSVTLIIFQGHRSAKQFKLKILCSHSV